MKIIRFISEDSNEHRGIYDQQDSDYAREVKGDIFNEPELASTKIRIVKMLAPIVPVNIMALGINYKKHGDETMMEYPEQPILFLKATTSVTGNDSPIILPLAGPNNVDYEAELAVIIGKKAKNISKYEALDYVLGYTCANDVSARDWQFEKQKGQWARGKSFDSFCPLGPWIVSKDEIDDPDALAISASINGEIVQNARTSDMIFSVREIISNLSKSMTLLPGTVILTGTPEGVGFTRQPPLFLKNGDIVEVAIEQIGCLSNPVISENGFSVESAGNRSDEPKSY
jgi:2-keto-4-pentenoate hydratase/2-oxohepta-3-ene-1,7-dioic acid hydratase in catechol pathway